MINKATIFRTPASLIHNNNSKVSLKTASIVAIYKRKVIHKKVAQCKKIVKSLPAQLMETSLKKV